MRRYELALCWALLSTGCAAAVDGRDAEATVPDASVATPDVPSALDAARALDAFLPDLGIDATRDAPSADTPIDAAPWPDAAAARDASDGGRDAGPSCSMDTPHPWQSVGFNRLPLPPPTVNATITAVDAAGLVLRDDPIDYRFEWWGPPLPFVAGERVTASRSVGGWDTIRGERATAAAWNGYFEWYGDAPPAFGGAMTFRTREQCRYRSGADSFCCAFDAPVYALEVRADGVSVAVAEGHSEVLGAWTITNVNALGSDSCVSPRGCIGDLFGNASATLLGPGTLAGPDGGAPDASTDATPDGGADLDAE